MPGKNWIHCYPQRQKQYLTLRFGENIKSIRTTVSKSALIEYVDNISNVLKMYHLFTNWITIKWKIS